MTHINLRWMTVCAIATACGGSGSSEDGKENQKKIEVSLAATVTSGPAPLTSMLSASSDAVDALFAFDLDGDGVFDTEPSAESTFEVEYSQAGSYTPSVTVISEDGEANADGPTIEVTAATAVWPDLQVDTNRDGTVTKDDDLLEETFTRARGGVVLPNLDDDDGDGERDSAVEGINGANDEKDLTALHVASVAGASAGAELHLLVEPSAADARIRIIDELGNTIKGLNDGVAVFDAEDFSADRVLWLEDTDGRSSSWDGHLTVTATLHEGAESRSDVVALRSAPVILPDNLRTPRRLFMMPILDGASDDNSPFYNSLLANLDDSIELYEVDAQTYGYDRWLQDSMQTGYIETNNTAGRYVQDLHLQTEREGGYQSLEALLPLELLGPDRGYAYRGGAGTSHNFGGNLEIVPPLPGYPFGRILVGGGSEGTLFGNSNVDRMNPNQRSWLSGQRIQGSVIELSSEWLWVGHLDEIFLAIPDVSSSRGWRYLIASPDFAVAGLEDLEDQGHGSLKVFEGRSVQTTVSNILADDEMLDFNVAAQARIDSIRERLKTELGLVDSDFIEVPVMYEPQWQQGFDYALALNPGIQNLVVAGQMLFIPDPEGPVDPATGADLWRTQTLEAISKTGNTGVFVDVFDSYHLLAGEAHCGTNFERDPFDSPWWEVE